MHGILYLDKDGVPVSPLYTWQDGRGDLPYNGGLTYAAHLSASTGYSLATGFGAVTHFYNTVNKLVPKNAVKFCTVHDYLSMKLSGKKTPLVHQSDAASLGLYDAGGACFDQNAVEKAGMDYGFFPAVTAKSEIAGEYNGIPVSVAIGDNQASFLGSVADAERSVLVNVGTGAQVSFMAAGAVLPRAGLEVRPYLNNTSLVVGSSLCGGYAYSLWKRFCESTLKMFGLEYDGNPYDALDAAAESVYDSADKLKVNTKFKGTRQNPTERGGIGNLGADNFSPEFFSLGILEGTAGELYGMYAAQDAELKKKHTLLIGSGNGIRRGRLLREILGKSFGMPLAVPEYNEEAAYGAALFGILAAGIKV